MICYDAEGRQYVLDLPTGRVDPRRGIGWTPADREMSRVVQKRESKALKILARLRQGPATTWDLAQITPRFSARLQDLEQRGMKYERQDIKRAGEEHSIYTMVQEPKS